MTLCAYDDLYRAEFGPRLCGVDEAGRGPLAGPVCAAAVVLPPGLELEGLDDSKKLTPQRREQLEPLIKASALGWSVAFADNREIDRLNIAGATHLAMQRAVEGLSMPLDLVLVDGNRLPYLPVRCRAIIRGDVLSASIAAASILAKVARDREMERLAARYPGYGFEQHKGYPTQLHYARIAELGITAVHRLTFLKKLSGILPEETRAQAIGRMGEAQAARHLEQQGFTIVARNYRCPHGELDLVAQRPGLLLFVEVKTRTEGGPLLARPADAVDGKKRLRLQRAIEHYLAHHPSQTPFRFDVVEVLVKRRPQGGGLEITSVNQLVNA
ncbi:MAG: ribonuclease HII [Clostridiales bacterium]|nr:ribonuclease HII [Clostridiales bacterium]